MTNNEIQELKQRYVKRMHAVQTGVAFKMQIDPSDTTPKHLRTGINSSFISNAALVNLLIRKGYFLEEEYLVSLNDEVDQEVKKLEEYLSMHYQNKVTLA